MATDTSTRRDAAEAKKPNPPAVLYAFVMPDGTLHRSSTAADGPYVLASDNEGQGLRLEFTRQDIGAELVRYVYAGTWQDWHNTGRLAARPQPANADALLAHIGYPSIAESLGFSENFAEANPHLTQTAKDHILALCKIIRTLAPAVSQPAAPGAVEEATDAVQLVAYAIQHADSNQYTFEHYESLARAAIKAHPSPVADTLPAYEWKEPASGEWLPISREPHQWERELGIEWRKVPITEHAALSGKYGEVMRPFLAMMEHELHANAGKGDRPGWLAMSRQTALLEIYYHVAKLQKSAKDDDTARIGEHAADVANMAMMLADLCNALLTPTGAPSP